jgi:dynein heavy chain
MTTVLLQEILRFNRLLDTLRRTLKHLRLAIDGLMVMSEDLDASYSTLLNNQVPALWERVAYPSLKPLASWILDLIERVAFMNDWLKNGNPNCYWLSGLFFP